jgi:hypothetical protein
MKGSVNPERSYKLENKPGLHLQIHSILTFVITSFKETDV